MIARTLFVSDLDGTLLGPDAVLSEYSRRALRSLIAGGLMFTVATARATPSIRALLGDIALPLPVIELNGAFVTDLASGRHLMVQALSPDVASALMAMIRGRGLSAFIATSREPCKSSEQCPEPQRCVLGSCSLHAVPAIDARSAQMDAPIDGAPIDAMRPPCTTAGLGCSGTATMFTCGGNCWVRCTGNAPRETARAACAGWMGALGEIDDATEQGCVAGHVAAATWIGLIQSATATTPAAGWTWNGTTPVVYTTWATGKPDDADNQENGAEQCGSIRIDGTWDDDNCGGSLNFLCERP